MGSLSQRRLRNFLLGFSGRRAALRHSSMVATALRRTMMVKISNVIIALYSSAMCQQWLSIVGLLLDIVGFLVIAFEWRHMYVRERERRMDELHHDYERSRAEIRGEEYADPRSGDYTMARLFSKLFMKEWRYRGRLFYGGVVLVILGFIRQTLKLAGRRTIL
jgi:hypothetical protein